MSNPESYGPYTTQKPLAVGGQGNVWLAQGPDGEVVLKIARLENHKEAVAREIKAHHTLGTHPQVTRLLDAAPDGAWLATERVFGLAMDKWAANAELPEIVAAASALARTLADLHGRGVVHGDIKPANVLVDVDGNVKVLDFGCAVVGDDAPHGFRGTPGFAPPEVLRGARATAAADAYGFGATLYATIAGRPPFVAPDPAALAYLPQVSLPEPVASFRPRVPSGLSSLVMSLLSRDPARRPDLAKVADALGTAMNTAAATSIVGMRQERDILRRAVVGAADGECRVVVVYGPAGSGRRTLIGEAAECAKREAMPVVSAEPKDVLAAMKKSKRPPIVAMRNTQTGAAEVAKMIADTGVPGLFLLHSDRPVPAAGQKATHVTPPPLTRDEVELLVRALEGEEADLEPAERWWRESFGHPAAVIARWRAERCPIETLEKEIPPSARKILQAVQQTGEITLPDLATRLGTGEHEMLDFCEVLFAAGMIEPAQGGAAVRITALGIPMAEVTE